MNSLPFNEADVIREISPNEQMPAADREVYYSAGRSALQCISVSLRAAQTSPSQVRTILDFPCGHGRVLRYLRAAFPQAQITACDIMSDGVDFCAATFGALPVYSQHDPMKIGLRGDAFDLIWVGSLFTHLDAGLWSRFLRVMKAALSPSGVLVFTTHGYDAYRRMVIEDFDFGIPYDRRAAILDDYERSGFGYVKYPGNDGYYGLSLSSPSWVMSRIAAIGGLRVVGFSEIGWVNFHDTFACVREPGWQEPQALLHR